MQRADHDLAFMLQYENIAWFEDGIVRILDRRVYPAEVRFEICKSSEDVARAIKEMVTQSAGPYSAAAMGMALAAFECRGQSEEKQLEHLKSSAQLISTARPTTEKRMRQVTENSLKRAEAELRSGASDLSGALFDEAIKANEKRYKKVEGVARNLVTLLPQHACIMTQCFAETVLGLMMRMAGEQGKSVKAFCPETRPYFQGARLTATVLSEMGCDVTVISDNMPAFVLKNENIDFFTSAADAITMDGHVVNKVGTYQIAIAAAYHGIPYYATGSPEPAHKDTGSIKIEFRDPDFVLHAMGRRTAKEGVKGYYPAFDITPPELVRGIVTDLGIYAPDKLYEYLEKGGSEEMAV